VKLKIFLIFLVYTLWEYPEMTITFKTFPNVLTNIQGGAGQ